MQAASDTAAKTGLLAALGVLTLIFIVIAAKAVRDKIAEAGPNSVKPTLPILAVGFVTNFFDTLGIGSFAPLTSAFKLLGLVRDEHIPGTLNVGGVLPVVLQTFIFTQIVPVEVPTLFAMIAAAVAGAWLGAGVVARMPRRQIQLGLGLCLMGAAILMALSVAGLAPGGGEALGVSGAKLGIAVGGNFVLGALMTLGIGLYAPCMILVSFLGMNVTAAFPIMMGSCAFLMPVASAKFVRTRAFDVRAALGVTLASIPAVLIAAYVVKSLPLNVLRGVVVLVVLYASVMLLRSARAERMVGDNPRA